MAIFSELGRSQNQILASLPEEEIQAVMPHLKLISLHLGQELQRSGASIVYIYFPIDCVISSVAATEEGKSVEVGVHGREGAQGIEALLGQRVASNVAIVRAPGRALRIREHELYAVFSRHGVLHNRLIRYTLYLLCQATQAAVCLRVHRLQARLCRWLLMGSDCNGNHPVTATHELLSSMLGASRPEVSAAANALRKAKLIAHKRGLVSVLNRAGLEAMVCDCYRTVHAEFIHFGQICTSRTHSASRRSTSFAFAAERPSSIENYARPLGQISGDSLWQHRVR